MNTAFGPKVLPQDSPAIPLLEKNDAGRGLYISHVDRSPLRSKVGVFAVVFAMYIGFSILIVWRASKNYHVVLALVLNDFYFVESGASKGMKNGFWSWCWMFMVASFDYYLLRTLWPPVFQFITGHLWFRLCYGFHKTEVVFRAPTGREYDDMLRLPPAMFQQVWQTSLLRATSDPFILENNGFGARSSPWELCCWASMDAHRLAKDGVFDLKNWELSVWKKDEHQRWTVWETWRHRDPSLSVMAFDIIKKKLKAEGREEFVAKWEVLLSELAGMTALASPPAPALEGFARSINALFVEEGLKLEELWLEAMSEADLIRNQPQLSQR